MTDDEPVPGGRPVGWARAVTLTAALGLLAGCGGAAAAAPDGATLRVVIPDASIREPAVPCSGAYGFRYAHPQAQFAVRDAAGTAVASGVLPEGVAEPAFTMDLGEARQPTVCVMVLDLPGLQTLDDHVLVIEDRSPAPIRPNPSLHGAPEVVLR